MWKKYQPTDDEVWNTYLWVSIMKYSRIVSNCYKIKAEIAKEKIRKNDEEEITLQKLQDFGRISVLVHM